MLKFLNFILNQKVKLFYSISLFILLISVLSGYEYYTTNSTRQISLGKLQAFTEKISYTSGDDIPIFIHTNSKLKGQLYKITDTLMLTDISIKINETIQDNVYDPNFGFNWKPTTTLDSKNLSSGYYVLKLKNDDDAYYDVPIIITPKEVGEIAIVSSTNTWQAYNHFGGRSNYRSNGFFLHHFRRLSRFLNWNLYNVKLPYKRPFFDYQTRVSLNESFNNYHIASQVVRAELPLVYFLEKRKLTYDVYADIDFAFNEKILDSKLIIFQSHSEYWSNEMIYQLKKYINKGGKVIFLSGNNMYRKVEFNQNYLQMVEQVIDAKPVRELIGTFYSRKSHETYAPFKVNNPDHWVFDGLNLIEDDIFAKYSSNIGLGGSGLEMDIIGEGSEGFEVIAEGLNNIDPAHMVFKNNDNGGWVFNVSSIVFAGCLNHDKVADKVLENLTNNALTNNQ